MKKSKWSLLLTLVLVLSMFLAACSGSGDKNNAGEKKGGEGEASKKPTEPQVLNILDSEEIPSLDSSQATDSVSFEVLNNVMEGLYRLDKDNKPTPGVAEKHEVSEDGTVYTFHLNPKATWSDGSKVTANDFVYAWRKALHPDTLSEYAYIMGPIKNANAIQTDGDPLFGKVEELGVKAVDESTLEVTLEAPAPYFLGLTGFGTFYPQKEEFVKQQGDKYALEANTLLYNGPFVLNEWKHNEGWQYKKNDKYWDKENVKLDEINVKIVKDVATSVNLYETGQTDITGLSMEYVDQYKDNEDLYTRGEATVFFLRLNQKSEALKNVNIRKAIDMAYDKQSMVDVLLNNGSTPAYYLVPGEFTPGPDGEDFRKTNGDFGGYDLEKAKELWAKGLEEIGKDSVELELLNYDTDGAKQMGEFFKNQLEKNLPGIKISIKAQPFKQKLDLESKGDYDFSYAGWGPDYQDPMTFLDMFVTNGAHNQMAYSNPEYDKLIEGAKKEADEEKRWQMMLDAEKILFEDQAISPLYQRGVTGLQKPYVKGLAHHLFGADVTYKWAYIEGKQ
ncbi:peptide ABC transporter substrate-binding protein [Fictibacillus phosphorivorans]|uniref:peptide ABC transporter substrate-binding protein n=1 Tax=Fictibacillus phosphorivorans TaxID=1221500 RepID=UPI00203C189F|nr:peptide ABC transporter substrate-binding protein [Fictibacillus phosphorivorans]MCM3719110.1 peptide ABC transporter substrate-binding protein [Fictibacillus phosphorivorans]MCM3776732.1 peptide ABC transporter substrate-binding protein [Fictibacillus phosphorivorans]